MVRAGGGGGEVSRVDESDGGKRRGLRNEALPHSGGAAGRGREGGDRIVEDLFGGGLLQDNC